MTRMEPVVVGKTKRGMEVYVPAVPGWDGFDKLTTYLETHFGAVVMFSADGPDARLRRVIVGDAELTLDYEDPYGTTIVDPDQESFWLGEIATDLDRRLGQGLI